jgi:hypothetical protein
MNALSWSQAGRAANVRSNGCATAAATELVVAATVEATFAGLGSIVMSDEELFRAARVYGKSGERIVDAASGP